MLTNLSIYSVSGSHKTNEAIDKGRVISSFFSSHFFLNLFCFILTSPSRDQGLATSPALGTMTRYKSWGRPALEMSLMPGKNYNDLIKEKLFY